MVFPTNTYTCSIIQKHVHEFHSVIKFRSHHYNKLCVEECILVDLLFYYCLVPSVKQRRPFSSKCSLTGILLQLLVNSCSYLFQDIRNAICICMVLFMKENTARTNVDLPASPPSYSFLTVQKNTQQQNWNLKNSLFQNNFEKK